jgi:uncharacterized protein involved in exopolysaccharide biosynthesis
MRPEKKPSWYLYVLLQNRRLIIGFLLLVMVPTVVITYLLEEKYTVTTTIMPPEERTTPTLSIGGLGVSEFAGYFSGGMGFSLPLMTTLSDVYLEVLQSRSLADNVIRTTAYLDSTGLREKYGHDETLMMYWGRKRFYKNYDAAVTPAGFLEVEMTTSSPMYSVRISERVIAVLDSTVNEIYSSRASSNRRFLERQIARVDSIRSAAADSLRVFEREHGVVALEAELTAFVGNLADLKSEYLRAAAQAQALRSALGGPTTASRELDLRAEALMDVIDLLESGEVPPGYEEMETGFSLSEVPDIQFRYIRHKSDFETAQKMASMLALNYQQAVLEETRSESNVRLLDPPRHPGWKSKPKKLYIWLEVFLVALLFIIAYVLIRERVRQLRREKPEVWSRWADLGEDIKSDLLFWRRSGGGR